LAWPLQSVGDVVEAVHEVINLVSLRVWDVLIRCQLGVILLVANDVGNWLHGNDGRYVQEVHPRGSCLGHRLLLLDFFLALLGEFFGCGCQVEAHTLSLDGDRFALLLEEVNSSAFRICRNNTRRLAQFSASS
jgi:hypothetical protein